MSSLYTRICRWSKLQGRLGLINWIDQTSDKRPVRYAIVRPTLFAIGFTGTAYTVSGILANRDTRRMLAGYQKPVEEDLATRYQSLGKHVDPYSPPYVKDVDKEYAHVKMLTAYYVVTGRLARLRRTRLGGYFDWLGLIPSDELIEILTMRKIPAMWDVTRAMAIVTGLNLSVYLAFRVPRCVPWLGRHFTHNPLSGKSYTLLTSTICHPGTFHFLFNTMAIWLLPRAWQFFSPASDWSNLDIFESTSLGHMLAFYFSSAVFGNLASHILNLLWFKRATKGFSSQLTLTTAISHPTTPVSVKVGGSAGIAALLGVFVVLESADLEWGFGRFKTQLSTIYLGAMLVELGLLVMLRTRSPIDHITHVAGFLFGAAYAHIGPYWWNSVREATEMLPP